MGKIVIGADLVPTESNMTEFISGDIERVVDRYLLDIIHEADFSIFNLEVPLCDKNSPITKCGPHLSSPTSSIVGLKKIGPTFFTVANNHIMDHGKEGLYSTLKCLKENDIAYAGAGNNLEEASKPFIGEVDGTRIGIYCCVEHEFSFATCNQPGANPYDPLVSFDHIKALKERVDIVIVLYHGGKEHYRYPSPRLQKVFRKFVEYGADYVVAQHSHCIGCIEKYMGAALIYGQGNFLFDHQNNEFWQTSVLLRIDTKTYDIEVIPCVKNGAGVRPANRSENDSIISALNERSNNILLPGFLENSFSEYAKKMRKEYYTRFSGRIGTSVITRILNRITDYRFLSWLYPNKTYILNCLECEAHQEMAIQMLRLELIDTEEVES